MEDEEERIRRIVSEYLSLENVKRDVLLQSLLKDGGVSVTHLMKTVLQDFDAGSVSSAVKVSEGKVVGELSEEVEALVASAPSGLDRKTVELRNLCGDPLDIFDARDVLEASQTRVVFKDELSAIRAVEEKNGTNWRTGLRVALYSGKSPEKARELAGLPPASPPPSSQHPPSNNNNNNSIPTTRQTGRLAYLKPGKYGFIKPLKAKTKDDNFFFLLSDLRSSDGKLKLNDLLEYTPDLVVRENGDEKKQARDVVLKKKEQQQPAPVVVVVESQQSSSPPLSSSSSPDPAAGAGSPESRPMIFFQQQQQQQGKAPKVVMAKGPDDDSIGFLRSRPSLSKLNVGAEDFVPGTPRQSGSESSSSNKTRRDSSPPASPSS